MDMKSAIKQILPPLLFNGLCKLQGRRGIAFEGNYPSWRAALAAAGGYDAPAILERVRKAALKVQRGEAVFERDSVCFYQEEYRWPPLACLLKVAAENDGRLRVLDFGGSLGSFYFQHKKHFAHLREVCWSVVEQSHYVNCGQDEFQDEILRFYETIEDCLNEGECDVIFCSSVLQYLEKPYNALVQFADSGIPYILLDRTPFIASESDRLTVQHVPPKIYPTSYPAWFFSRQRFAKEVKKAGYREFVRFDAQDDAGIGKFEGVLFEQM